MQNLTGVMPHLESAGDGMKRRSFFQSILKAAAIIALAPQIAFRTPVKAISPEPIHTWEITVKFGTSADGEPVIRTWRYEAPDDHLNKFDLGPAVEIKEVTVNKFAAWQVEVDPVIKVGTA